MTVEDIKSEFRNFTPMEESEKDAILAKARKEIQDQFGS
jgi:hypothetical protein